MSLAQIFSSPKGPQFGSVEISAAITESHGRSAQVTKSAIESGSEVSDHRRLDNFTCSIDGIISSHNLTAIDDLTGNNPDSASDVMDQLIALFEDTAVFKLTTNFREYDDCVFTSLVINRDPTSGGVETLRFKADIEQLRFAFTEVDFFPAEEIHAKTVATGPKPTKPAPPKAVKAVKGKSTFLKKLVPTNLSEKALNFLNGP